jgi:hypothetical protein
LSFVASSHPIQQNHANLQLSLRDYTTQKKDLNNFLGEEEDHFRGQEKRDFFLLFFFFWGALHFCSFTPWKEQ